MVSPVVFKVTVSRRQSAYMFCTFVSLLTAGSCLFASLKDLPEVPEYEELRRQPEEEAGYGQLMIDFDSEEENEAASPTEQE